MTTATPTSVKFYGIKKSVEAFRNEWVAAGFLADSVKPMKGKMNEGRFEFRGYFPGTKSEEFKQACSLHRQWAEKIGQYDVK